MKSSRSLPFHTRRDAWVEVNLGAIEHNCTLVRQFVPPELAVMAVIKADAYGHGSVMVLPTLEASGIQMVGVAAMDEALQIREAGLTLPTLVLGASPDWAMHYAAENDIQLTIFSQAHLDSLNRLHQASGLSTDVHIKVDTGMHRIGIAWDEAAEFIRRCQASPGVQVKGVFSHLAHTDDAAFTQTQIDRWHTVLNQLNPLPPYRHLSNSAGTWHYPTVKNTNMVRVGISLFGYPGDDTPVPQPIRPTMALKARIVHLHTLPPGQGVSYGQTFVNTTGQPMVLATLPLGYADGVPRLLSNKINGLYRGQTVRQVGSITMDQMMMDVTGIADIAVGDVITLVGQSGDAEITLTDWAKSLGTIEYELMCGLRVRLPKTYVR